MAKTTPDMIIQVNVSAPGLEVAIKALTDAVLQRGANGAEVVIPAGSAIQVTNAEAIPAQPDSAQTAPAPMAAPQTAPIPMAAPAQPAPAPVAAPEQPAPVPMAAPQTAPVQQVQATQSAPTPAPVPAAQGVTLESICNAGAKLVEQGQMNQVIQLLGKYGVQAVNQIKPEQFAAFAADLRALGAQI